MGESKSYVSSSHTVAELKAMCKENGLAINGKKADLISRLNDFFTGDAPEEESISLEDEESISMEEEIVSSFKQFPLKLGWAVTIHKAQGLTLESCSIDLGNGAIIQSKSSLQVGTFTIFYAPKIRMSDQTDGIH